MLGLTGQPFLTAITGGSGSGKTTLAEAIADRLGRDRVSILPQDAYYHDRRELPPTGQAHLNYDVPEAFDRSLFLSHLHALRSGLSIRIPVYSFESHSPTGQTRLTRAQEIVLVDGFLLLFDPNIRELFDLRIFVDAPAKLRLRRRLRRDVAERQRTVLGVLDQFFDTVQPAYEEYVEPTKVFADLVLSNTGPLEDCIESAVNAIVSRHHQPAAWDYAHQEPRRA